MASGKKNYFRHSMNARNDHKLRAFMDLFGRNWREGYFYFFTLLEMCGSDAQEGKTEHTFHKKTLRDLWGTSAQGVHDVCMKCTQSALVVCTVSADHVTFSLPNLLNYTGKYDSIAPNKRKEKENKEKEINNIKPSPLSFLFHARPEIQKWLDSGNHDTHTIILARNKSHHELAELLEKAFDWSQGKDLRAETWLLTFVDNKKTTGFGSNQAQKTFKSKTNGVASTPENPTGDPYLQEAIDKGLVG